MSIWAGPGFLLGILGFLGLPALPTWPWAIMVAAGVVLSWWRWRPGLWSLAGFTWAWLYVLAFWQPLPPELEGHDWLVRGRIADFPLKHAGGWRFDFLLTEADQRLPQRLRLSWYGGPEIHAGQLWQLKVHLKSPRGFRNPGGFDYERWLFAHRVGATGYVRRYGNRLLGEAEGLSALRWHLADAIDQVLASSPVRGLVKALALGVRDGIPESQWQILRATGTAHLVAISGLHIGLVAGLLLGLGRRLWLYTGNGGLLADTVGAALALAGALGYATLAGFSLSTQRALLMLAAGLGAWVWRRNTSPWRSFSLALLGVCLWDPLAPLGAGFWLSFAAVAWILYGISGRLRPLGTVAASIRVQGILLLGLAPLLIYGFQQVGWTAPLANLVAVPLVGLVVVPVILTGCALWWLWPPLAEGSWQVAAWLLGVLWQGLAWLGHGAAGIWSLPLPSLSAVVLALLGIGLLLAPRGLPARWLGAVLLLPLLLPKVGRPVLGNLWLTVLDVGQGLAVVAETAGHVLVYDTGPRFSDRFDAGSDIVVPFLRSRGWRYLDLIVVSHNDRDHSGGLNGLYAAFPSRVLSSDVSGLVVPAASCLAGQTWIWDGVKFDILWPEAEVSGSENDRSCVLRIETAAGVVLLPGDLESNGEIALVARYGSALRAQVLVAPHHGSRSSSTQSFLEAVRPRYILVSSGYHNRFGFPHPDVLARYRQLGSEVVNTATVGAVTLKFEQAIRIDRWRLQDRHLWSWSSEESLPP